MNPPWLRPAEAAAAGLNLAYTVGYLLERPWAYPAALVGSLLFVAVCAHKRLLAEAFLWGAYAAFAVWGLVRTEDPWIPLAPDLLHHAIGWAVAGTAFVVGRGAMRRWTPAASVELDLFTTVGSLLATFWMVQNDPWNWRYWVVVNAAAVVLYARARLWWGMGLQVLYVVLALEGLFNFMPWP